MFLFSFSLFVFNLYFVNIINVFVLVIITPYQTPLILHSFTKTKKYIFHKVWGCLIPYIIIELYNQKTIVISKDDQPIKLKYLN